MIPDRLSLADRTFPNTRTQEFPFATSRRKIQKSKRFQGITIQKQNWMSAAGTSLALAFCSMKLG
jgi:hypothetical protein